MTELSFLILIATFSVWIGTGCCTYEYTSIKSQTNKPFQIHHGIQLTGRTSYKSTANTADYRDCIWECQQDQPRCKSINILKNGGDYNCDYFKTPFGVFQNKSDMIFVSKDPPVCSNYCTELEFMNPCGKCKCAETACGSRFSHFCDCTEVLRQAKSSCKDIKDAGYKDPAMYKFKNSAGQFLGFCEVREDATVLWLTMLRRFSETIRVDLTMIDFLGGFGQPHDENHWMGLEKLHDFTKAGNTVLRVEVATFGHHFKWYGEYGNFKITKTQDDYSYTASHYRSNFCIGNGFANGGLFGPCTFNRWFDKCSVSNPFNPNEIRWGGGVYQRVTLLLRRGSLNARSALSADSGVKIEARHLGTISHLEPDFCISFDLYTEKYFSATDSSNILCLLLSEEAKKSGTQNCLYQVMTSKTTGGHLTTFSYSYETKKWTTNKMTDQHVKKWVNVKVSKARIPGGIYMLKTFVDDALVNQVEVAQGQSMRNIEVYLGKMGRTLHTGRVNGLYINGKVYIGDDTK